MATISVQSDDFDVAAEIARLTRGRTDIGGLGCFIGVVRDRLGEREDRFFATVFLGSGLLFVAMLFTTAAVAGGILIAYGSYPGLLTSGTYSFGRAVTYQILNIYGIKMAGVKL